MVKKRGIRMRLSKIKAEPRIASHSASSITNRKHAARLENLDGQS